MITLVQDDSFDWSTIIQLGNEFTRDVVCLIGIAKHIIFDRVKLVVLVVHTNVNL